MPEATKTRSRPYGTRKLNKRGETWEQTARRVREQYPTVDTLDWAEALKDYDLLGRIMRDVLRVGHTPVRRGHRPPPDFDEGMARLRQLRGEDYTVLEFDDSFRVLAGDRSRVALARRTGLSKTQLHRLITGEVAPTGDEMAAVAAAFGKSPFYFKEYRTAIVCALVARELERSPETSIGMIRNLGLEEMV